MRTRRYVDPIRFLMLIELWTFLMMYNAHKVRRYLVNMPCFQDIFFAMQVKCTYNAIFVIFFLKKA